MRHRLRLCTTGAAAFSCVVLMTPVAVSAEEPGRTGSSYAPVAIGEDFAAIMARMKAAKAGGR